VLPLEVYNHQPFTTCASHKTSHTPRLIRQTIPTRNNTFVSNSTTTSTKVTPQYSLLVPFNPKVPGSRPERPTNIKVGSSDSSLRIFYLMIFLLHTSLLFIYTTVVRSPTMKRQILAEGKFGIVRPKFPSRISSGKPRPRQSSRTLTSGWGCPSCEQEICANLALTDKHRPRHRSVESQARPYAGNPRSTFGPLQRFCAHPE
jgi:hypothetical protein